MPEAASPSKDIVLNGRFLTQPLSGVQRYAREITRALDTLIADDGAGLGSRRWRLAMPVGTTCDLSLRAIEPFIAGKHHGHRWEQLDLWRAARGARLVCLGNSGPLLHRDQIVVIHDAAPYRTPANFGRAYGMAHRTLGRLLARTARLGTVSEFSRSELSTVLGIPAPAIFVAGNGADHLIGRAAADDVVARLGLTRRRFFLFVGSPTPNKNLAVALEAFRRLGRDDVAFVIAGSLNRAVFGGTSPAEIAGVRIASGLPDADIAGLYRAAAALVFPTRYEGFGIPPLEAMACGCPVIATDLPVTREVCGDAARYFPLDDAGALATLMNEQLDAPSPVKAEAAQRQVALFTWERAAQSLADAIATGRRSQHHASPISRRSNRSIAKTASPVVPRTKDG